MLAGTPQQALAEVSRLVMRHTNLTAIEAHQAAAAVNPSQYDKGGILLAQMRVWRQRRIAALEAEIERLIRSYGLNQLAVQQRVAALVKQQEEWQAQAKAAKPAAAAKAAGASSAGGTAAAADAGSVAESDPWQDVVHWVKEHGAVVSAACLIRTPCCASTVRTLLLADDVASVSAMPQGRCWAAHPVIKLKRH
jgi:hypothetical protein